MIGLRMIDLLMKGRLSMKSGDNMVQSKPKARWDLHPHLAKRLDSTEKVLGVLGKQVWQGWLVVSLLVMMIALAAWPGQTAQAFDRDLFFVTGFRITGHSVFDEETLQELIQEWTDRPVAIEHLEMVADQITRHYRNAGYPLAFAYVPAQDVEEGFVEIAVLEGRYDDIVLVNESRLKNDVAQHFLSVLEPGAVVEGKSMERALALLADIPGIESSSRLEAGETTGTTRLQVDVVDGKRIGGRIEADNFGNDSTGVARYATALTLNNVSGHGDQLTLHVLTTGKGQVQGQASYELPLLGGLPSYFSLSYSVSQYELGGIFQALQAGGEAKTLGYQLRFPLRREDRSNMQLIVVYESRRLLDNIVREVRKRSGRGSIEWSGDWLGAGDGQTRYSLRVTAGNFRFDTEMDRLIDEAGAKTQGPFEKLNAAINHYRWIGQKTALYTALRGQWATKNLDSSERFALAGVSGVRAYASGAGNGADGWLGTLEIRRVLMTSPTWGTLQLTGFLDGGGVRVYKNPPPNAGINSISRQGYGIGTIWNTAGGFTLQTHVAWKLAPDHTVPESDRGSQVWIQGAWAF